MDHFSYSLYFVIAKLQYGMIHGFIINCPFILAKNSQVIRFNSGDLAKMQSILQSASANLGIKNKKIDQFENLFKEK